MINGFVFNGKASWELGIEAELVSMPLSAEPKNVYIDIPTADGELDLSKVNSVKRPVYKPRIIEFYCHASFDPGEENMESKAKAIADALCTGEDKILRIAGASNYVYMGRASNLYNITPESDSSFSFPLVFRCQPFRWENDLTFEESVGDRIVTQNNGLPAPFRLGITGYMPAGLTIRSSAHPDKELRIPTEGEGFLIIDSETMSVTFNDVDITSKCSGDFFDLASGENIITVLCDNEYMQFSLIYQKKYI